MKGCICLDIDGTITSDPFSIPQPVMDCFEKLYAEGWLFLFVTGRAYAFASKLFQRMRHPFFFALQNGADLLQMPEKKQLSKEYLSGQFIPTLERLYRDLEDDFLVYSGWESGDFCYFRPDRFSLKMKEHLEVVQSLVDEPWKSVDDFAFLETESFPLIKSLGSLEQMRQLNQRLNQIPDIHATCIQDPLARGKIYLNLITAAKATKGDVLEKMRERLPKGSILIAAGDDFNDISMLKESDFAIAMKNAPAELIELADLIAEPADKMGIIEALLKATGSVK